MGQAGAPSPLTQQRRRCRISLEGGPWRPSCMAAACLLLAVLAAAGPGPDGLAADQVWCILLWSCADATSKDGQAASTARKGTRSGLRPAAVRVCAPGCTALPHNGVQNTPVPGPDMQHQSLPST